MKINQSTRQRQPDPETSHRRRWWPGPLREQIEDAVKTIRRDPLASVAHPHLDGTRTLLNLDGNRARDGCVLRGVIQHVREHLGQSRQVPVEPGRGSGALALEMMSAFLDC